MSSMQKRPLDVGPPVRSVRIEKTPSEVPPGAEGEGVHVDIEPLAPRSGEPPSRKSGRFPLK